MTATTNGYNALRGEIPALHLDFRQCEAAGLTALQTGGTQLSYAEHLVVNRYYKKQKKKSQ
ncbi:MAG: hypothetical protein Kow0065_13030 [Methylomicrobium sp.]